MTHDRIFAWLFLGNFLTSCGGGEPTGPSGTGDTMVEVTETNPSFAQDIQFILEARACADSGCHSANAGQAGLFLNNDFRTNYANLVNVPAQSEPGFLLVKPGDAENSYLVIRLEGRQSVGSRMPIGSPLRNVEITIVKNWINNGALNN